MLPYRLLADVESNLCDAFGVIVDENVYGKNAIQRSTFLFDAPNPISLKKKEIAAGGGSLCWWRALRARVSRARMGNEVSRELILCAFVWLDPGITPCRKRKK